MANTITGFILQIGQTVAVPTRNGQPFQKRELLLDSSNYDRFTGQKIENYPLMEFTQNNCQKLDNFKPGDLVTVSFVLSGVKSEKDGQVRYFTHVKGYDIVPYQRQNQGQMQNQVHQGVQTAAHSQLPTQGQQMSQQGQNTAQTAASGAPAQQPFPPAVDENGNPINGNADDLPF